jgi:hypothetical protein
MLPIFPVGPELGGFGDPFALRPVGVRHPRYRMLQLSKNLTILTSGENNVSD